MAEIKGIIFDLDGVITDTAEYHFLAWQALGQELGIDFGRDFNEKLRGISRMESLERILVLGGKENDYTAEEKLEQATKKNNHYRELIKEISPKDLLPGIESFLMEIKDSGIKMALASASKNGPDILAALNITELFEYVADPAKVAKGKPAPDIFLTAAEGLSLPVAECVGIEDAEAGVESIKSADMFAVGVGQPESMKDADLIVSCTSELSLDSVNKAFTAAI